MTKYIELRSNLRHGDIVLFRGKALSSRIIQWLDEGYYNHMGLVFTVGERKLILDSSAPGVNPYFLSERMKMYTDFCVIRPAVWDTDEISRGVDAVMRKAENGIRYDFKLLLQIVLYRKAGWIEKLNSGHKDICSEFIRRYIRHLSPRSTCFESPPLPTSCITPWDFIIYANSQFEILYDRSDKDKFRKVIKS